LSLSFIIIAYIFLQSDITINILRSPISFLGSFLFTSSVILLYLDDFKLSNVKFIKYIQICSLIGIPLYTIYYICNTSCIFISDIILYGKDNSNDVNRHGHVSLNTETGKALGQGINTIGSNIGLGATMAGIATAVGNTIAKSSMPPLQKVGVILGASMIAGLFHSKITTINRNKIMEENKNSIINSINTNNSTNDPNISKFIEDSQSSPLQDLLLNLEMTTNVCIAMLILLMIQILFKIHFKDNIKLDLSKILGDKYNNTLEYYINKIITLNKKMSTIYI
jgi:hypothetical protein